MPQEKTGKPDAWSDELWAVYEKYGDFDHVYVESCNRFLKAIRELYKEQISELILELTQVELEFLDSGVEPHPEDRFDVYRAWYKRHIKWDRPCFCETDDWFVDPDGDPLADFKVDTGEWVMPTQIRPWFLGASIQLAKRLAKKGEVPEPKQGLLSKPKSYNTKERIQKYLTESGWAVDQLWFENAPEVWLNNTRRPDESLKDFINGLFKWLNFYMALQITEKGLTRPHHRKELKGGSADPENRHEEILVRKMFGEKNKKIIEEMGDVLPTGDPENAKRAIRERVKLMAEYLGLIPPTGDKT
jgi:hypothetical protein